MVASVCGFYGHNNYGDSLMRGAIWDFFKVQQIDSVFVSDIDSSESLSYRNYDPTQNEFIVLGGGGIITSNFWFFKEELYKKIKDNQKLIIFNVNLTKESIEPLSKIKNLLKLIVVRDIKSFEIASTVLSKETKILFANDISLVENYRKRERAKNKIISVCPNAYVLKDFFSSDVRKKVYAEKFIVELSNFLKWAKKFNDSIFLLPCQVSKQINDNTICGVIDGFCGGSDFWCTNNLQIENYLIQSDLIISMRYHTTLFAAKYGIPFIDICHHSKNLNFLHDNCLEKFSINYWESSLDKLIQISNSLQKSIEIQDFAANYRVSFNDEWSQVEQWIRKLK